MDRDRPRAARTAAGLALAWLLATLPACDVPPAPVILGRPGVIAGEFDRPRGVAAAAGRVAVVDMTGRVQRFRTDGTLEAVFPVMPEGSRRGFPLGILLHGDLSCTVVHTHEAALVEYDPAGRETARTGEFGVRPDQFCMPQRAVPFAGGLLVSDFGYEPCRVVKHRAADGTLAGTLGGPGTDAVFARPMGLAVTTTAGDPVPTVWVADTTHRIFRLRGGRLLDVVGAEGARPGELRFPTGLAVHPSGGVIACEAGNHRLQWFGEDGRTRGVFGRHGTAPGEFRGPYDVAVDDGRIWVADTDNHRVQGFVLASLPWRTTEEAP